MGRLTLISKEVAYAVVRVPNVETVALLTLEELRQYHTKTLFVECPDLDFNKLSNLKGELLTVSPWKVVVHRPPGNGGQATPQASNLLNEVQLPMNELADFIKFTCDTEAADRLSFVPRAESLGIQTALTSGLNDGTCLTLSNQKRIISLTVLREINFGGVETRLLAWVWIDRAASLPERIECQQRIDAWVPAGTNKFCMASIHLENKRSLSFFQRLRFQPTHFSLVLEP